MPIGNLPIYLSLVLALIGIIFSLFHLKSKNKKFIMYSRITTILLFATITTTLLYLYVLFITSDVSFDYIWRYSSTDLPLQYKFSGLLAGMSGSLLFWIWAIITPWLYEEIKMIKKPVNKEILDWTRISIFIVISLLMVILSLHEIFNRTPTNLLLLSPNGQGLNPLLQTELMIIHPPIIFLAYGFLVLPFASAIAHLITGHKDWILFSLNWSRLVWIFLTLGIGIGAIWAYVVLGWGGYWGWDPVETSSLIPWVLLTGFLHVQLMYKRKKHYMLLAPIMGILSFILVIFATFVTRAGGLWVSVHTFGTADIQKAPWDRFISIISESQTILIYLIFIIVCIILTIFLSVRRYNMVKKENKERFYSINDLISDDILMLITTFIFVITTIVIFILLISSMNFLNPSDFNIKVGFFGIAIIFVLFFCLLWRYTGRKWITIIGIGILLSSMISYFVFPSNSIVAISMPILIVALIGTFYKIFKSFNFKKIWPSIQIISAHLIHLAIIFIIIGYVSSNYLVQDNIVVLSEGGNGQQVSGYIIKASNIEKSQNEVFVDIEIWDGNNLIGNARPGLIFIDQQTRNEIRIVDTLFEDIYLIYQQINENNNGEIINVEIQVKILPLIKLLWTGMWLMAISMFLRLIAGRKLDEFSDIKNILKDIEKVKNDKYYDKILEKELEN
jgi:cytochrome c-type biogenesis protein CcmF